MIDLLPAADEENFRNAENLNLKSIISDLIIVPFGLSSVSFEASQPCWFVVERIKISNRRLRNSVSCPFKCPTNLGFLLEAKDNSCPDCQPRTRGFPLETNDMIECIDLAYIRLYLEKLRAARLNQSTPAGNDYVGYSKLWYGPHNRYDCTIPTLELWQKHLRLFLHQRHQSSNVSPI